MDSALDPFFVQRRIRSLRGIALRHLEVDCLRQQSRNFSTAFTITCPDIHPEPCYVSCEVHDSVNPTWEELDVESFPGLQDISSSSCLFQLFLFSDGRDPKRLLWLEVDLRAVIRVGDSFDDVTVDFPKNSVIFLLRSGVYVLPGEVPKNMKHPMLPLSRAIRKPYSVSSLRQVIKLEKDLIDVRERKRKIDAEIRKVLDTTRSSSDLTRSVETITSRVKNFDGLLVDLRHSNQDLRHVIKDLSSQNATLSESEKLNGQHLVDRRREREQLRLALDYSRRTFRDDCDKLSARRCELLADLKMIYPIHQSASGRLFIGGIWLPSVDQHTTCDDTTLSASLGCAAHLLTMLSRILDIPLRYPIRSFCSTSSVIDHITARVIDRDREYPLYPKNRDRSRFSYGVFLLNLCIAQLRLNCHMGTTDIKKTLENIRSFMEEGLRPAVSPSQSAIDIPVSSQPLLDGVVRFSPMENGGINVANGGEVPSTAPIFPVQSAPDFRRLKASSINGTSAVFLPSETSSDVS